MNIVVHFDATEVTKAMRLLYADQLPFATSVALNETAKRFQDRQVRHMNSVFDVGRPQFVNRAVKIKPFANKRSLVTTVQIEPPGGRARADVLSKFEEAHTKRPMQGEHLAIPVDVKIGSRASYERNKPSAYQFKLRGSGPKAQVFVGDRGTFMIRPHGGKGGGIFMRTGKRTHGKTLTRARTSMGRFTGDVMGRRSRTKVRMLYSFTRTAGIDDRLHFTENAVSTVRAVWSTEFGRAFDKAVRTARTPPIRHVG